MQDLLADFVVAIWSREGLGHEAQNNMRQLGKMCRPFLGGNGLMLVNATPRNRLGVKDWQEKDNV